ncbi:hypothetical protein L3Q82_013024 [Scortum barcoo]|uniref:Uncharacterized protein n=1 Tax=Scortum barcoo TaxID=214431 RepID=A0ACB8VYI6_9TELE|nr:hypothetical protein L3Q82_013024 [Scortum barcoo]
MEEEAREEEGGRGGGREEGGGQARGGGRRGGGGQEGGGRGRSVERRRPGMRPQLRQCCQFLRQQVAPPTCQGPSPFLCVSIRHGLLSVSPSLTASTLEEQSSTSPDSSSPGPRQQLQEDEVWWISFNCVMQCCPLPLSLSLALSLTPVMNVGICVCVLLAAVSSVFPESAHILHGSPYQTRSSLTSRASGPVPGHRIKDRDYLGWMDFGRRSAEEYEYSS